MPSSTRCEHRRRAERGQASVEVALLLPMVVVLLLGLLQVAVVGRDQLALELAAREAARAASVSADPTRAAGAAARRVTTLAPLGVAVAARAGSVTVTVTRVNPTDVPLAGRFVADIELRARATMAWEPP
jgi:Flp pilus assembly protein TadG